MFITNPVGRRKGGACERCVRKKRKCDHKKPHCTECLKHNETCQPRLFKSWARSPLSSASESGDTPRSSRRRSDKTPFASPSRIAPSCRTSEPTTFSTMESTKVDSGSVDEVPGTGIFPPSVPVADPFENEPQSFALGFPLGTAETIFDSVITESDGIMVPYSSPSLIMPDMIDYTTPMSTILSPEPMILYCPSPWPDDMQSSPRRQFLWNHFIHSMQMGALCLDLEDVSCVPGFQDPFVATIPQMALSNATLREAAMCFSVFQYTELYGQLEFISTTGTAWRKASEGLHHQLARRQDLDGWGFLSMISACCLLHWCAADQGENCLRLATKLAVEFLQRPQSGLEVPSTCREVILTGFRWTIIATLCSLKPPSRLLDNKIIDTLEMDLHEVAGNYSPAFGNWTSHPLYAFSSRLVNPLLRMGHLAEVQLLRRKDAPQDSQNGSDQFEQELLTIEETLLQAREADLMAAVSPRRYSEPLSLAALNEAMHAASFILFYTRFRHLPFTAPVIRRQVKIVVSEICKIPEDSRVSHAILFPLFIAACEAVDTDDRCILENRLRMPRGLFFDRGNTTAALHRIWEVRDLQPGLAWPDWVNKVDAEYRIWNLF